VRILRPCQQRKFDKEIFGFDIETKNNNKGFVCASIWGKTYKEFFFSKEDVITAFLHPRFRDCIVAATNLSFDFFGVYHDSHYIQSFNTLFRGSQLLFAKTYIDKKEYVRFGRTRQAITFIDTGNFANLSVEKLGKIIGIKKLRKPNFLGQHPKNRLEWEELLNYNMRDSEVSAKALQFLFSSFQELGATPKLTIASTAMNLFKSKYLDRIIYPLPTWAIKEQFKGYYGGRTEALKRGSFKNYSYYDFNSLYPSVMLNAYPDPNSWRHNKKNCVDYIENFDGIADVDIYCPDMNIPLLPLRHDNKLIFPTGNFRGWYTHVELRRAIQLGYVIKKVYKTHYTKTTCRPFTNYVNDLYNKRLGYKELGSPMEYVTKILLNSLYGKFGQKFEDRDNWIPAHNVTMKQLASFKWFTRIGDYIFYKQSKPPSSFCIPLWAAYVTAYARIKLFDAMIRCDPIYVDTDSLITKKSYATSMDLGALKLEMDIEAGVVVKPKLYAIKPVDGTWKVKAKGLGFKLVIADFVKLLINKKVSYTKFVKFKEAMRRGLIPNEIIMIGKELGLEDNKRIWDKSFNKDELQESRPIKIESEKSGVFSENYISIKSIMQH